MSLRRPFRTLVPYGSTVLAAAVAVAGLQLQHARLRSAAFVYWRHRMDTSADATRAAVQTWLDRLERDNHFLANEAAKLPNVFRSGTSQRNEAKAFSRTLTSFATDGEYRGIWVLRIDGTVVAESDSVDSLPTLVKASAIEAMRSGERQTAGPLPTHDGEQLFAVVQPISSARSHEGESILGSVVLAVDPYATLFPTVLLEQDGVERSRHRLVQHVGNEFVVLTPSDVPAFGPGELRLPWGLAPSSGALAASARDSSGALRGIEEVPIIAATRHIPETGWGLVRALEEKEAYTAAEGEFHLDILFVGTLFVLGLVLTVGIRRRQRTVRLLAVADSEARYRLLAKHATDLIIRRNLKGEVLYVSPSCRQMLGYEPEELLSEDPIRFVHPDDVETARAAQLGAFRNPLSLPVQYRVRRSDESYAWLETTGQPVLDPFTHELTEIVTVSRDISARRAIEEEGERLAQRNALLLESAAEGIFGLDRDGTIIFINPAAERIVGWPARELLGKSQHTLLHHSRPDGTLNSQESCGICMTARTGRGCASHDDIFWRRDGSSFPVEYQSTPFRESGVVVGAVVTFRDVTARRRANLELVRAKEDAEAANAAKSDFLARMSHELRTPLNSVIGFSNVLRKNKTGNLNAQDLGYLQRIGTNGVQLLALINDILDLSKIEAGKIALDISTVSLGQLVEDTVVQLADRRYKDGVSLEMLIPASLEPVETDAAKLRQVLINLVGNALKFTHSGTVVVAVEADSFHRPLRISVTDTGIGIAPDRLAAVFVAFEQADTSTSREYGGTGLGLSISHALCELLGFRLEVESSVGCGTKFTIELSSSTSAVDRSNGAPATGERSSGAASAPIEEGEPRLVLVIEDDADARELMRVHVEELGHRVALAATGEEGLQLARELDPQLITLDLMMPGMDGWELLKRLAADAQLARIPVIIVSSIAGEVHDSFVGAVDWLNKPIAHGLLCDAIKRNIECNEGGVLIVEDDPDARELLMRFVSEERAGALRVASNGAAALAMLEHHLPDLVLLDLSMPAVDGFAFLETIRQDPRLRNLAVIVVTAQQLSSKQRALLSERTIAVLEKGATLEEDLTRVLRGLPRRGSRSADLAGV